jgi:hypothetical protein
MTDNTALRTLSKQMLDEKACKKPVRSLGRIYTFLHLLLNSGHFLTQFRSPFHSPAEPGQRLGYGPIPHSHGQPAGISQQQRALPA